MDPMYIEEGMEVIRKSYCKNNGKVGSVIKVEGDRAYVFWKDGKNSWIKIDKLKVK